jgi:hypothetical protein
LLLSFCALAASFQQINPKAHAFKVQRAWGSLPCRRIILHGSLLVAGGHLDAKAIAIWRAEHLSTAWQLWTPSLQEMPPRWFPVPLVTSIKISAAVVHLHMGQAATKTASPVAMASKQFVDSTLKAERVAVFSKSYCPYCEFDY